MESNRIRPLHDFIVVKPASKTTVSRGGIILPNGMHEKLVIGEVVAVGMGRKLPDGSRVEIDVKVGDRVIYRASQSNIFKGETEEYLMLRESDLVGTYHD